MNGKINNVEQLCSVRKLEFIDGKEKGRQILLVNNGVLSFIVLLDKCMDIYEFRHKGMNLTYISKGGLMCNEGDFIDTFPGGLIYTCGLEVVGNRTPMHGSIHNKMASITNIKNDGNELVIEGEVVATGLFKDHLVLKRIIKTSYMSDTVVVDTIIENRGYKKASYCLLLHMNIGYPFLDDGLKINAPIVSTTPRDMNAKNHIGECLKMNDNIDITDEQVFYHKVKEGRIELVNEKVKKSLLFEYDHNMFEHFIEWKSLASGDYALGIEPSTTTLDDEFQLKDIEALSSHCYKMKITAKDI